CSDGSPRPLGGGCQRDRFHRVGRSSIHHRPCPQCRWRQVPLILSGRGGLLRARLRGGLTEAPLSQPVRSTSTRSALSGTSRCSCPSKRFSAFRFRIAEQSGDTIRSDLFRKAALLTGASLEAIPPACRLEELERKVLNRSGARGPKAPKQE